MPVLRILLAVLATALAAAAPGMADTTPLPPPPPPPPPPSVTAVSPAAGPVSGGTTVTISGSGFTSVTSVSFGTAAAASFTVVSASSITAVAPAGSPGAVQVEVAGPYGSSGAGSNSVYTYRPVVTGLSITSGTVSGGDVITISGAGFTGASAVSFGDQPATDVTVVTDSSLTATTPGGSGIVDVTVTTNGATSTAGGGARFTYLLRITGLTPGSGPPGTQVHVLGIGFDTANAVRFDDLLSGYVVVSDTELIAIAPPGGGSVAISVATNYGTTTPTSLRFGYGSGTSVGVGSISTGSPTSGTVGSGSSDIGSTGGGTTGSGQTTLELRLVAGPSLVVTRSATAFVKARLYVARRATFVVALIGPHGKGVPLALSSRGKRTRTARLVVRRGGLLGITVRVARKALVPGTRYTLRLVGRDAAGHRTTLRLPITA